MTDAQPSGIDLARAALLAARASAKDRPVQPQKKTRTTRRSSDRRAGDPMGLGVAIDRMMTERGWEPPEAGGSILDQWPTIAPELAGKVAAVRFEHDTGVLHLRPASPAYATQLRLFQAQTLRRIHEKTGGRAVRALRILPPGTASSVEDTTLEQSAAPAPEAPVRTRADGCTGYQDALAVALEHKPGPPPVNPYVEQAMRRQEAALRANRLPEDEHREAGWVEEETIRKAGPVPGSMEASEAAARAYARSQVAGRTPRRAFDAA